MHEHHIDLDAPPAEVRAAVGAAAEMWGAAWEPDARGGTLRLPVLRGLRKGVLEIRVATELKGSGSSLALTVEASHYRLNTAAAMVLLLGAAGGLVTALWPFFPRFIALVPAGALLAVAAWLLVVSRLRSTSPEDFLGLVKSLIEGPEEQSGPAGEGQSPSGSTF